MTDTAATNNWQTLLGLLAAILSVADTELSNPLKDENLADCVKALDATQGGQPETYEEANHICRRVLTQLNSMADNSLVDRFTTKAAGPGNQAWVEHLSYINARNVIIETLGAAMLTCDVANAAHPASGVLAAGVSGWHKRDIHRRLQVAIAGMAGTGWNQKQCAAALGISSGEWAIVCTLIQDGNEFERALQAAKLVGAN